MSALSARSITSEMNNLNPFAPPPSDSRAVFNRRRRNHTDHGHPTLSSSSHEQRFALGSREDVQQEDYVSPIAAMYTRAWTRFRNAEEARQTTSGRTSGDGLDLISMQQPEARYTISNGPPQDTTHGTNFNEHDASFRNGPASRPLVNPLYSQDYQPQHNTHRRVYHSDTYAEAIGNPYANPFDDGSTFSDAPSTIDLQHGRPNACKSEDLKVDLGCKVCKEQRIDTITMPCMHAAMCHWCAQIWKQGCRDEFGKWQAPLWTCVVCRKQVKETRRFFV
ncbi:hypothetical protein LTS08_007406 [Lithohypha guttulata]|nr:hypothetical protein LTS08_007406 [Lithohypha guttulata]